MMWTLQRREGDSVDKMELSMEKGRSRTKGNICSVCHGKRKTLGVCQRRPRPSPGAALKRGGRTSKRQENI